MEIVFSSVLLASCYLLPSASAAVVAVPAGSTWANQAWGDSYMSDASVGMDVVFVDGFDRPVADIAAMKAAGQTVVCYISFGTLEDWRDDYSDAGWAAVKGDLMGDWPGEYWLDITKLDALKTMMQPRLQHMQEKGYVTSFLVLYCILSSYTISPPWYLGYSIDVDSNMHCCVAKTYAVMQCVY